MTSLERIDALIASAEKGEPIDWRKVSLLTALDCIRMGEMALDESLAREKAADAKCESIISGNGP